MTEQDYPGSSPMKYDHHSDADSGYDDHGVMTIPVVRTVVHSDPKGRKISTTSTEWISVKKSEDSPPTEATTFNNRTSPPRETAPGDKKPPLPREKKSSVVKMNSDFIQEPLVKKDSEDEDIEESRFLKEKKNDIDNHQSYRFVSMSRRQRPAMLRPTIRDVSVSNKVHYKEETTKRTPRRKIRSKSADGRMGSQNLFSPTYSKILSPDTMRRRRMIANILKRDCILDEEYYKVPYEECNREVINGRLSSSETRLNALQRFKRGPKWVTNEHSIESHDQTTSSTSEATLSPPSSTDSLRSLIADILTGHTPDIIVKESDKEKSENISQISSSINDADSVYNDGPLSKVEDHLTKPEEDLAHLLTPKKKFSGLENETDFDSSEEGPSNPFKSYYAEEEKSTSGNNGYEFTSNDLIFKKIPSDDSAMNSDESNDDVKNISDRVSSSIGDSKDSLLNGGRASSLKRGKNKDFKKKVSFSTETEELYYLSTPSDSDTSVFEDFVDKTCDEDSGSESFVDDTEAVVVTSFLSQLPMQAEIVHVEDLVAHEQRNPKKRPIPKPRTIMQPFTNNTNTKLISDSHKNVKNANAFSQEPNKHKFNVKPIDNVFFNQPNHKTDLNSNDSVHRSLNPLSDKVNIYMSNGNDSTEHEIYLKTQMLSRHPVVTVSRVRVPFSTIQEQWDWVSPFMMQHKKAFEDLKINVNNNRLEAPYHVRNIPIMTSDTSEFHCGSPSPSASSSGCFSGPSTPSPSPNRSKATFVPTDL